MSIEDVKKLLEANEMTTLVLLGESQISAQAQDREQSFKHFRFDYRNFPLDFFNKIEGKR